MLAELLAKTPRDELAVGKVVDEVAACLGEEALFDAIGTAAFFSFMTRVVDASGHTNPIVSATDRLNCILQ